MKKIITFCAFLFISNLHAQFDPSAPLNIFNADNSKKTLTEMSALFNDYWKDKDRTKKGSGFKVFKRWEYRWQNYVDSNGFIQSPSIIWDAFKQKQLQKNRNSLRSTSVISNWQSINLYNANVSSTIARGRVNVVYVDPNNANTIYMGTPAGGIWKSTNSGTSWTPLNDEMPQIGVSGIAVEPGNSNVIYIATGDADAGDSYSIGVMKSTDGGTNWSTTGLSFATAGVLMGDIIINP